MKEEEEEEYKGKIKFYDEEMEVLFPKNFDVFKEKLGEMLGLTEDLLNNVELSYKDEDGDSIDIKTLEDYMIFFESIKNGDLLSILIEVKDLSESNIKKIKSNIIDNKNKKNSNNINLEEHVLEKSDEKIIPKNDSNINNINDYINNI